MMMVLIMMNSMMMMLILMMVKMVHVQWKIDGYILSEGETRDNRHPSSNICPHHNMYDGHNFAMVMLMAICDDIDWRWMGTFARNIHYF